MLNLPSDMVSLSVVPVNTFGPASLPSEVLLVLLLESGLGEGADALDDLRHTLIQQGTPFMSLHDVTDADLNLAADAIRHAVTLEQRRAAQAGRPRWRWVCEKCDDGDCEQHWMLPRP
ncbi:hypothetical protein [Aquabacterium sp.]|uniref:hypothetical protein n=1 Tax=Aquabacterium sp. TaxID=1872578 RepID=UPI0035AEA692